MFSPICDGGMGQDPETNMCQACQKVRKVVLQQHTVRGSRVPIIFVYVLLEFITVQILKVVFSVIRNGLIILSCNCKSAMFKVSFITSKDAQQHQINAALGQLGKHVLIHLKVVGKQKKQKQRRNVPKQLKMKPNRQA